MQLPTSSSSLKRSPSTSSATICVSRSACGCARRSSIWRRKYAAISCVAACAVSYFSRDVRDEPMNSAMSSDSRLTSARSLCGTPSIAMITRHGSGPAKSAMKSIVSRSRSAPSRSAVIASTCGRIACIERLWKNFDSSLRRRVCSGGSLNTIHCDR